MREEVQRRAAVQRRGRRPGKGSGGRSARCRPRTTRTFYIPSARKMIPASIGKCKWMSGPGQAGCAARPPARRSVRSATRATTSKYTHHSATETPSAASRRSHDGPGDRLGRPRLPSATIDSPSATMMMRPCRSAKCAGAVDPPARGPPSDDADVVADQRRRPQQRLHGGPAVPRRRAAAGHRRGNGGATSNWRRSAGVVAGSTRKRKVGSRTSEVAGGEDNGTEQAAGQVVERLGDRQRRNEQRRHRGEHRQSRQALVGLTRLPIQA